ncbi:MAG TPA: hypothetical protein VHK26_08720 [Methyloceanibacter sp.]|jgi:hypothetical protein|nr:hypothetical protein [Methyloceanibacter sp.]
MAWDENANVCAMTSEEASSQPLTRQDCSAAGMTWNDNANVCDTTLRASEIEASGQPLTRNACAAAGMTWNEKANVCGEEAVAAEADSNVTAPGASSILVNIDKSKQRMTVLVDGVQQYHGRFQPARRAMRRLREPTPPAR